MSCDIPDIVLIYLQENVFSSIELFVQKKKRDNIF